MKLSMTIASVMTVACWLVGCGGTDASDGDVAVRYDDQTTPLARFNPQPDPPGARFNPQPDPPGARFNPQPDPPGATPDAPDASM